MSGLFARQGEMTSAALVDRLAPLCLVQFHQDREKDQKLKALTEINAWQRRDYVEKQGRATMSGEKQPDSPVAIECAKPDYADQLIGPDRERLEREEGDERIRSGLTTLRRYGAWQYQGDINAISKILA